MLADAVLFDLDGVLIDSRLPITHAINASLVAHGFPERPASELHQFIGPPVHETFERLGAGSLVQTCVDTYRARYVELAPTETRVFDGIPLVLAELAARVPLVIATSKAQAHAVPLLDALGLSDYFIAIIGPDLAAQHESKGTTIGRALGHLAGRRRPVMIGDRRYDVEGAREHAIPTIGVLWGIGDADELRTAGAVALAQAPEELPALIGMTDASPPGVM